MRDYDQMVYDLIKPLALQNPPVKIYRNAIDTDYNSQPHDYIVYSSGVSNTPRLYGDGKVLARRCNCDITVNEVGNGNNDKAGYLIKQVRELLTSNNIHYFESSLGYIESVDSMQTNFDFYLI